MAATASFTGLRPSTASCTSSRKVDCARAASGKAGRRRARSPAPPPRRRRRDSCPRTTHPVGRHAHRAVAVVRHAERHPLARHLPDEAPGQVLVLGVRRDHHRPDFDDRRHRGLAFERRRDRELDRLDLAGILALFGIVELRIAGEGQHGEGGAALLHPGHLIVVLGRRVAARQRAGLEHRLQDRQALLHRRAGPAPA